MVCAFPRVSKQEGFAISIFQGSQSLTRLSHSRIDYVTENAGLDFSDDGMVMYVAFQDSAVWQFWREDGLPFHAKPAKKCKFQDTSNDIEDVLEPFVEDIAKDLIEEAIEEL